MAARSSNEIIQEPYNPSLPPIIDLNSEDNLVYEHHQTDAGPDAYDFFTEKFVDFDSLKANEIDIQYLFYNQQWQNYFEMLNGFVYYDIVKYFWQKAKVYDRASADKEYKDIVEKNKELRGKTRKELGLKPYREREIRSNILGINVVITQAHIAKILGLDNKGEDIEVYDNKSKHLDSIHQDLFKPGCSKRDVGKIMHMKHTFEFAFRMCLSTIFTRKGGLDSISIPHKHFIWFLYKRVKVNLAKILFDHMCFTINEGRTKIPSVIHHPRLISELIRQTKLTDIVSAKEKLRVFQTAKYDASVLVNMKRKTKEEIIQVKTPLQQVYEKYFWCDGFPTISEHDNDEVIENFLEAVRRDTGVSVPRKMVVSVPNWDIFKGPRDITRNRRKPRTTEQEMIDEGSDDQKHDSADEIEEGERGAGNMMAEAVQKEKHTKKRHDRPSASEEDQNLAKPAKKLKVRTSKPKGIRLKRFKQREEEALIFPSDIDADVRELEYLFGKSLRILSTHLKDKIKGRGANTVREMFEIVEKLNAPRLTSYNHVKEQARIAAEEEEKRQAEIEHKRLAEQEALKLLVDRAVHIATFETNKINENQAAEQDVTMLDQNLIREDTDINEDSDKGKKPIFIPTPSHSPMKIDIASTSSTIPPAVQDALDNIRTELTNEIDELRVDVRTDVNAAVESVHKRMDDMMLTLLKAIADVKKPYSLFEHLFC
ncbi:hypothetical protein QL285_072058 [Trifolium repens]|nr:hypothetical protein QL285_072058 [Trifolium repens]